jgi:two-component system, sensor histidine kinase and response regulator
MTSSAVDLDDLLDRVGGDRDIVVELIEIFLEDAPALVAEVRDAGSDLGRLQRVAHTLKGASGNMGAHGAQASAERLQHASAGGDTSSVERERAALLDEMARVTSALEGWRATLRSTTP